MLGINYVILIDYLIFSLEISRFSYWIIIITIVNNVVVVNNVIGCILW